VWGGRSLKEGNGSSTRRGEREKETYRAGTRGQLKYPPTTCQSWGDCSKRGSRIGGLYGSRLIFGKAVSAVFGPSQRSEGPARGILQLNVGPRLE